ncbi:hypothetical protein llap_16140 [Limosa lapponica baueri]|uniref:Rna-directed dna polymerase from mobile element jockey-like n=1 Tax=Limosa lapponica baueri TaxID=1758121 RepID=A0A2I0T7R2_LIMLA|nr:hypothetical protein llap_19877 [Limosa lapponica baueri]PKU33555.1 hypothetical protein llap_16140 [Limosa lapponica baueri]
MHQYRLGADWLESSFAEKDMGVLVDNKLNIPLQGLLSLERVNSTSQYGIVSKVANGAFNSCIQIIDEYFEQNWSPRIEPRGTPLVTHRQPDVAPFTIALPFRQFFTQRTVNLPIPQLDNLSRRML